MAIKITRNNKRICKGIFCAEYMVAGKSKGVKFFAKKQHEGQPWMSIMFDTEREAKVAYDKRCIALGLEPKYVFKRKLL